MECDIPFTWSTVLRSPFTILLSTYSLSVFVQLGDLLSSIAKVTNKTPVSWPKSFTPKLICSISSFKMLAGLGDFAASNALAVVSPNDSKNLTWDSFSGVILDIFRCMRSDRMSKGREVQYHIMSSDNTHVRTPVWNGTVQSVGIQRHQRAQCKNSSNRFKNPKSSIWKKFFKETSYSTVQKEPR